MEATATKISTVIGRPRASARRRTRRIALTVPVEVSGKDFEKFSFTVLATATSLNLNGAMLHLNRDLLVDSVIVLQNSHGARTSARIVAQTILTDDRYAYGVEFLDARDVNDFWGISFPNFPSSSQSRH
jgi:hypothetical protein